jgi:hypothetical protein
VLRLLLTLHRHEDLLRVHAAFSPAEESATNAIVLRHPTRQRHVEVLCAGEWVAWPVAQAPSILTPPPAAVPGTHLAAVQDPRGLAILSPRGVTLQAANGDLSVTIPAGPGTAFTLTTTHRPLGALPLGHALAHLGTPLRPSESGTVPALIELVDGAGHLPPLTPLWIRRPDQWAGELMLADHLGQGCRCWLRPGPQARPWREVIRCDAAGGHALPLKADKDGAGYVLDVAPNDVLFVRWR